MCWLQEEHAAAASRGNAGLGRILCAGPTSQEGANGNGSGAGAAADDGEAQQQELGPGEAVLYVSAEESVEQVLLGKAQDEQSKDMHATSTAQLGTASLAACVSRIGWAGG